MALISTGSFSLNLLISYTHVPNYLASILALAIDLQNMMSNKTK